MGTNYYWTEKPPCECCKREFEPVHIGKSSAGWCFALHIHPDDGIYDLEVWKERFATPGSYIKDECGDIVTVEEMIDTIRNRSRDNPPKWDSHDYARNYAQPGPNNLIRHRIGEECVGHGAGTWDLIDRDFS